MFQRRNHIAALCLALGAIWIALPASAQWVAVGRWGTDNNWRYVAPGTWQVLRRDSATQPVSIHAEGDNHVGRIELWCDPQSQTSAARFSAYRAAALHQPAPSEAKHRAERVVFSIDGQRFERTFDYDPITRVWQATDMLDAAFLDAFSWGTRMDLLNDADEIVTGYALNGSGAAREALRQTCGQ